MDNGSISACPLLGGAMGTLRKSFVASTFLPATWQTGVPTSELARLIWRCGRRRARRRMVLGKGTREAKSLTRLTFRKPALTPDFSVITLITTLFGPPSRGAPGRHLLVVMT